MIAGQDNNELNTIQMDFVARRFDTFSEVFTIEYYDDDGVLQEVDLTGAEAQMQLKKRKSDSKPFFNMDVAISGNELTISKNHTMMDMPAGKYWHDIEVKNADGNHITWVQGRFIVVEHVTQYVDTFLATLWVTIKSTLQIEDVPKTLFGVVLKSILNFKDITVHWLGATFQAVLAFTNIEYLIYQITGKFISELTMSDIPKIIFVNKFTATLSFLTGIDVYSTARFEAVPYFLELQ